jgi:hypothetical protein
MITPMTTTALVRHAPLALWQIARAFIETLHAMFGGPEAIATRGVLTSKPYALLLSWLRCGEAMMRRLLMIEAQAFAKPNTRPLLRPTRTRVRKAMSFEADQPETWRVSFRCFSSSLARGGSVTAGLEPGVTKGKVRRKRVSREDRWSYENFTPAKFHNAWPLAKRYEALLRVFNDPAPYARRLSRRLHATPHRAVELRQAPPEAEHRIERFHEFTDPPPPRPSRQQDSS